MTAPGKRYYPAFLDLEDDLTVVIGEGDDVVPRTEALLAVGARVRVVSNRPTARLSALAAEGAVELRKRRYEPGDLQGATLAVVTGIEPNDLLLAEARGTRVSLSVVDRPEVCDWIHGSVVRRGRLVVAISTSGAAPALGVRLRQRLERELGSEYERFLEIAAEHRLRITKSGLPFSARRELWYRIVDSPAIPALRSGDGQTARAIVSAEIERAIAEHEVAVAV